MQEEPEDHRQISRHLLPIAQDQEHSHAPLPLHETSITDCLDLQSLSITYPPLEPSHPNSRGREDTFSDTESSSSLPSLESQVDITRTHQDPSKPRFLPENSMHPAYYTEWDHQYEGEPPFSRSPSPTFRQAVGYHPSFSHDDRSPSPPLDRQQGQYQGQAEEYTSSFDEETLFDPVPGTGPDDIASIFPSTLDVTDDQGYEGLDYLEAVSSRPALGDEAELDADFGEEEGGLLGFGYMPSQEPYRVPHQSGPSHPLPHPSFDLLSDDDYTHHHDDQRYEQRNYPQNRQDYQSPNNNDNHHNQYRQLESKQTNNDEDWSDFLESDRSHTSTPILSHTSPPRLIQTSPQVATPARPDPVYLPSSAETNDFSSLESRDEQEHMAHDVSARLGSQSDGRMGSKRKYYEEEESNESLRSPEPRAYKKRQLDPSPTPPIDHSQLAHEDVPSPAQSLNSQSPSTAAYRQIQDEPSTSSRKRPLAEETDDSHPSIPPTKKPCRPPAPKVILAKAPPKPLITSPKSSPSRPKNAPLGMRRAIFTSVPTRTPASSSASTTPNQTNKTGPMVVIDQGPEEFIASYKAVTTPARPRQRQKVFKTPFGTGSKGGGITLKPKDPNAIVDRNNRAQASQVPSGSTTNTNNITGADSSMSIGAQICILEKEARILRQAVKYHSNPDEDDTLRELISTWRTAGRDVVEQIFDKIPEPLPGQEDAGQASTSNSSWGASGGRDDKYDITPEQERWLATCRKNEDGDPVDDEGNTLIPEPRDLRSIIEEESRSARSSGGKAEYYPRREYDEGPKRTKPTVEEREWNIGTMMMKMSVDPALLGWDDDAEDWLDIDSLE